MTTTGSVGGAIIGEAVPAAILIGLGYVGYKLSGGSYIAAVGFPFVVFTGLYLIGVGITGKT